MIAKSAKLAVMILCLTSGLSAQEAPCTTRTLLVNVLDQKGKPAEVSADRFRAKYHGHPVDILSVASVETSPRIVLLLDASENMRDGGKWETEQLLAQDIVRSLPDASFALMVFAGQIQDKLGFAQGSTALAKKLNDLPDELNAIPRDERKAAIYDALLAALDELRPTREADTLYVITDGRDNKSSNQPPQADRSLVGAGVRVFAFLLVGSVPFRVWVPAGFGPRNLADLAQHTGGTTSSLEYVDYPPHQLSDRDLATIVALARLLIH